MGNMERVGFVSRTTPFHPTLSQAVDNSGADSVAPITMILGKRTAPRLTALRSVVKPNGDSINRQQTAL